MSDALDRVATMVPALLFLCVGVPFATSLDRIGYFDAVTSVLQRRAGSVSVVSLWSLACATTALLNLDTTVVLLTPLYVRLAVRTGMDPFRLALIPLLTASLASSFLPISNLTTLIVVERLDLSVADVALAMAAPGAAACTVGFLVYRRSVPSRTPIAVPPDVDRRALRIGSIVVVGTIVGFLIGPTRGVDPWIVVLAAVGVLAVIDRSLPWRRIPVTTAVAVALVAFVGSLVVPEGSTKWVADVEGGGAVAGTVVAGAGLANLVNNLPALVIGLEGVSEVSPGVWAWLLGVNTGAALLPTGALANLLWWRIARDEGVVVEVAHYVRATAPVVTPALAVSALVAAVVISVR